MRRGRELLGLRMFTDAVLVREAVRGDACVPVGRSGAREEEPWSR